MAKEKTARVLTEVEIFYIINNPNLSNEDIASKFEGATPQSIANVRAQLNAAKPIPESVLKGKTEEEQREVVKDQDTYNSGKLFARQEGVTVMTEAASELSDARKTLANKKNPNWARDNAHMVHTIRKK